MPEFERVRASYMPDFERAALFADLCRLNTLSMIAYAGSGHIGSSFSSLDIVTWLFLNEMGRAGKANGSGDLYFSSKGHDAPGLYAAMIALRPAAGGRAAKLRRLGGLPGHPDVGHASYRHQYRFARHGHLQGEGHGCCRPAAGRDRRIFVMTGDGELQEGQIWESLVSAANHELDKITVSSTTTSCSPTSA